MLALAIRVDPVVISSAVMAQCVASVEDVPHVPVPTTPSITVKLVFGKWPFAAIITGAVAVARSQPAKDVAARRHSRRTIESPGVNRRPRTSVSVGTPDEPFCAAATIPMATVLARFSAPERGVVDRRLACGRRHPQHRLPSAVLCTLQSGQVASVLAPAAAHGTTHAGHASVAHRRIFGVPQTSEVIVSVLNRHLVRLGRRPMPVQRR